MLFPLNDLDHFDPTRFVPQNKRVRRSAERFQKRLDVDVLIRENLSFYARRTVFDAPIPIRQSPQPDKHEARMRRA